MVQRLNRKSYQKLIDEDMAWLEEQPRSLERDHIRMILDRAVEYEYGDAALAEHSRPVERSQSRSGPNHDRHNVHFRIGYQWDHEPTEAEITEVEQSAVKAFNQLVGDQEPNKEE